MTSAESGFALAIALLGAAGVHLMWTGRRSDGGTDQAEPAGSTKRDPAADPEQALDRWLRQAGLGGVSRSQFFAVSALVGGVGYSIGWLLFAGPLPSLICAIFAMTLPAASFRTRRTRAMADAAEAWPRLIDEIRLLTGSLGRSIPAALFDAGAHAPDSMRPAFATAHREWLLTRDFDRTTILLRNLLEDPTADATCETLLVAHELGGADLDSRLSALSEDRRRDVLDRKDAASKQAGVRFARKFVLLVPVGMALAGMSVGEGRAAYATSSGQIMVAIGVLVVVGCWIWSGRIMKLPHERRAFEP
jgi:tight adherence protein B